MGNAGNENAARPGAALADGTNTLTTERYHSSGDELTRHRRSAPCPVCHGFDAMPRGKGRRCHGYTLTFDDGHGFAYCARVESNTRHPTQDLWGHRLDGEQEVRKAAPKAAESICARSVSQRVEEYIYTDRHGEEIARKVRCEPKFFFWEVPSGKGAWRRAQQGEGNPGVLYELPVVVEASIVHVCEGEKAADAINRLHKPDVAATCSPITSWSEDLAAPLFGKRVILWVDRDDSGIEQAKKALAVIGSVTDSIATVRSRTTGNGDDAYDHLEKGYELNDASPFEFSAHASAEEHSKLAERFSDERTSIAYVFSTTPKPREFLVESFLPARESGFVVAQGGTGKGHFQVALTLALALGEPFGPFDVPRPRGVVLLSVEDDREELHRRLIAALMARQGPEALTGEWPEHVRTALVKRIRFVDLRGLTGTHLGTELRDSIAGVVEKIEDPGLVLLDPLTRLLPQGLILNEQSGGGTIVNELDAIRDATGCTVLVAHHINKAAIREKEELYAAAATGTQMLSDLARWMVNLKSLTPKQATDYGLEPSFYVEAAVTKSNYTPPLAEPLVFRREAGGALSHCRARSKAELDDQHALTVLLDTHDWLSGGDWEKAAKGTLAVNRIRKARGRLLKAGKVETLKVREKRRYRDLFAPAQDLRPTDWPAPPTTFAEYEERKR